MCGKNLVIFWHVVAFCKYGKNTPFRSNIDVGSGMDAGPDPITKQN
jgi:hypothetical protein